MNDFLPNLLGCGAAYVEQLNTSTPFVLNWEFQRPAPIKKQVAEHRKDAWKQSVKRNYKAILELNDGWDGYHAKRISDNIIGHIDVILQDALAGLPEAVAPYIIPAADGSVQVEWNNNEYELEFYLSETLGYSTWLRDRETGREFESEGNEAINLLFRWAPGLASPTGNAHNESVAQEDPPIGIVA